jgi:hypothetical protein
MFNGGNRNRRVIAALSGDRQSLDVMNKLETASWSDL